MKKMLVRFFNKNTLKIFWLIYALLSIIVVVYFADHLLTNDLDTKNGQLTLNDNWNITINNKTYENVSLDEFKFDAVDKGASILMETTLPKEWSYENTALTFHVRQTTVKMYADNELFYEYGHQRLHNGKTVGSGIQIINMSNEHMGKTLKIHLTVAEDNAFTRFDPVTISEWRDSYRFIITENRLALFTGAFLVIFGLAASLITVFAVIYSRKYVNILLLSAFSIFIGFWTLCYHNITIIFSIPTHSASLLEYMTLMMAPLPILGYMYSFVKALNSKPLMILYKILFGAQIILSILTIVLHTTDIAHSAAMLPYSQILFVIHSLFFAYVFTKRRQVYSRRNTLYTIGLFVILSCIIYDLLIYLINRYAGLHVYQLKGVSSLGIIVFLGILILDLAHDMSQKMLEEHEKELLVKRAYTDQLTQINNRTFCAEYMLALESKKSNNYTIINFDLNNLKIANDTQGHAQGDLLIKSAADVISEAFSTAGIVGRMGGDEFIAIIPTSDKNQITNRIHYFEKLITKINQDNPLLNLSISYGYATNTEIENPDVETVYQLADERMYENKRIMKAKG